MKLSERDTEIVSLAWPAILGNLTYTLVSIIDMAMVGTLGPAAVASVGLGGLFLWVAYSAMSSVSVGTTALVARFKGAGEDREKNSVMAQSILIVALLSVFITLAGVLFSDDVLAFMGAEREVVSMGGTYLRVIFLSSLFVFVAFVSESGLRGAGDTRTPMKIDLFINGVNILLDYLLIFGKFGLPQLGVLGAAIASAIAFTLGGLIHLAVLSSGRYAVRLNPSLMHSDFGLMRRLLRIGIPASIERLVMSGSFMVYTGIIMAFGTVPLAATQIGIRIEAFSFMPGIGFSVAAAALVGQSLGAKDREKAYSVGWETSRLAVLFMGGVGLVMFLFAPWLVTIFTRDPEVIRLGTLYLRIVGVLQPFQALLFVLAGGLDGAGDTRWVLYTTVFGLWLMRLPLAYFSGVTLGLGVLAAWLAMMVDVILRSVILGQRYRSKAWMDIRV
ncbi:MAG: MATE family efflux transporter [Candidatus Hydrothermarchaeaceae archaeon]